MRSSASGGAVLGPAGSFRPTRTTNVRILALRVRTRRRTGQSVLEEVIGGLREQEKRSASQAKRSGHSASRAYRAGTLCSPLRRSGRFRPPSWGTQLGGAPAFARRHSCVRVQGWGANRVGPHRRAASARGVEGLRRGVGFHAIRDPRGSVAYFAACHDAIGIPGCNRRRTSAMLGPGVSSITKQVRAKGPSVSRGMKNNEVVSAHLLKGCSHAL